ncbi:hypothetical protein [Gloeobacter kilaueensis]|uniref:Uncharacterized protein n=1 Tax=Gloeobacter kilaueensis (strain ATCC BAA-2537 / CCAP 1431/1 / ULC 316 / JS1) TaxID=1183438 RepID=U5QBN7_GLOK1|nr:hypothetical protein [Gloeobacter kilaueensis]AGY56271.1 hypothetical protein GKIL_0024 [Gloeobacter kilaueensis JS1]
MQEWRLVGGMFVLAAFLSILVKYVLPLAIRQPLPLPLAAVILAPAAALALWLVLGGGRG